MKITHSLAVIILILYSNSNYGQDLTQTEALELGDLLNNTMSENIQLTLRGNKASIQWDTLSRTLDLRHKSEIARDGMSEKKVETIFNSSGRYIGDIYWRYYFMPTTSSKASFKANKHGQLFLKLSFQEQDTLLLKSRLNAFSCHHRSSDSKSHQVLWSGEKYVSLLLQPGRENNAIRFLVRGITLSGKFERKDPLPINKNYTKDLRGLLKREFQNLFEQIILNINTSKNKPNYPKVEVIAISD